jgi:hypothetical protein
MCALTFAQILLAIVKRCEKVPVALFMIHTLLMSVTGRRATTVYCMLSDKLTATQIRFAIRADKAVGAFQMEFAST